VAFSFDASDRRQQFTLKFFVNLHFRARKWAYLKTYKEEIRKFKERKNGDAMQAAELHGKGSGALMPS